MSDIGTAFARFLLAEVVKDVRQHVPDVKLRDAWVYSYGRTWEFHYKDFFWHGRADNAYDARAKGWGAYLRKSL